MREGSIQYSNKDTHPDVVQIPAYLLDVRVPLEADPPATEPATLRSRVSNRSAKIAGIASAQLTKRRVMEVTRDVNRIVLVYRIVGSWGYRIYFVS
jgi:hypothetical protein